MILFDLDGVLADSRPPFTAAVRSALEGGGWPVPAVESEITQYLGPPLHETFLTLTGGDDAVADACVQRYREHYRQVFTTLTTVQPGVADALAALPGPLGVVTSKPFGFSDPLLTALGLRSFFDWVAAPSFDVQVEHKPETLARAIREHALVAADCVLVGDTRFDAEAAAACGARCLGVSWGIGSREELLDAGAYAVVDTAAELVSALSG